MHLLIQKNNDDKIINSYNDDKIYFLCIAFLFCSVNDYYPWHVKMSSVKFIVSSARFLVWFFRWITIAKAQEQVRYTYLTWIIFLFPFSLVSFQAFREHVKILIGNPINGNGSGQFSDGSESVPICRLVAVSDINDKTFADSIRASYIRVWIIRYHSYLKRICDPANVSWNLTMKESLHSAKQSLKLALFPMVK